MTYYSFIISYYNWYDYVRFMVIYVYEIIKSTVFLTFRV